MSADPRAVFDAARDVSQWAAQLPHYRRSEVRAQKDGRLLVQFVAVRQVFGRLGVPVTWRAICWSDERDPTDLRLHFRHVRGVTRGMRVTWHIRPATTEGSDVTIVHE